MSIRKLSPDLAYTREVLTRLLEIPSPTGFTDEAVRFTCGELDRLGIPHELTRRGAIRADLKGRIESPDRAIVAHLDTIGAMVRRLKDNGRLELVPIGTWSSRFAEGARVTVFADEAQFSGTILPIKASGHAYHAEVDALPVAWENVELRLDHEAFSRDDLEAAGVNVGDYVAVLPRLRLTDSGFINARHLDDKAGVAVLLATARAVLEAGITPAVDCHLLFTITEETGSGASAVLHGDVAEMVTIDSGPVAPAQSGSEFGVTVAMMDSTGPFDYHLTHKLLGLCRDHGIRHQRDVFRHYRSDSASALEAGNDIRTALVCFGADATHGYERCHEQTLSALGELLSCYIQSPPTAKRDRQELGPLTGFPHLPIGREGPD